MIRLVLGGQKSGKSAFALSRLMEAPGPRLFLATGRALDAGMREQIAAHRRERGPDLPVWEVLLDAPAALARAHDNMYKGVLLDSLDFWLFHELEAGRGDAAPRMREALEAIRARGGMELTLVSSEIGLGPVPASAATRAFARELGALNQAVAALSDEAALVAAGLPLYLKRA